MTASARVKPSATREATITRTFDAPRNRVFQMWTDSERMAQWWGPKGFTNPVCEVDARPGGAIRIHMRAPDGVVYPMTGTFRAIAAPERLAFASVAEDEQGRALLEGMNTVTFEEQDGRTKVTVQASAVPLVPIAERMVAGMEQGWTQSLERLADSLRQ
jgi:uncharacterized protein YndB with AHSA1/START domain